MSTPSRAELASVDEIMSLVGRRERYENRRAAVWERSCRRHDEYLRVFGGAGADAVARLGVSPLYPASRQTRADELIGKLNEARFRFGKSVGSWYPRTDYRTQVESVVQPGTDRNSELIEVTEWGSLSFGFIVPSSGYPDLDPPSIPLFDLFLGLLRRLHFAWRVHAQLGMMAPLRVTLQLDGVRGRRLRVGGDDYSEDQVVHYEESVVLKQDVEASTLIEPEDVLRELLDQFLIAFNAPGLLDQVPDFVEGIRDRLSLQE